MPTSSKLKTKILFLSTEIKPFLDLSSTATLVNKLVNTVAKTQKYEIRVIMPRFGLINERTNSLHEVQRLCGINITVEQEEISLVVKVGSLKPSKVQIYFLDNEYLFERKGFFHDPRGKFYKDNHRRLIFINKSVLSVLTYLRWNPQIIHAISWPWVLFPMYAKTNQKSTLVLKKAKYIYTHNDYKFEPQLAPQVLENVNHQADAGSPKMENLYKLAEEYVDAMTMLRQDKEGKKNQDDEYHQGLIEDYQSLYSHLMFAHEKSITSNQAHQSLKASAHA